MYDDFPFEKWKTIGHRNRIQWKLHRAQERFRYWRLKRRMTRETIAETRVDFTKVKEFRADTFPESGPYPWLDRPNAQEEIDRRLRADEITAEQADLARKFDEDGYVILEGFFDHTLLDDVWAEYEREVYAGKVPVETYQRENGDLYLGRCLNPHLTVPRLRIMMHDKRLLDLASFLLGVQAIPFQTITGFAGSEQRAHSDSIHMTTYPLGYLAAAWMAFEDIHPDSGPLEYYPGSHRLSYLLSRDLVDKDKPIDMHYKRTTWYNHVYENAIGDLIRDQKLEPHYLDCKKGDVLIWHANLLHGGSKRKDPALSRRAMVAHYFGKGAFCYGDRHEMMLDLEQG